MTEITRGGGTALSSPVTLMETWMMPAFNDLNMELDHSALTAAERGNLQIKIFYGQN